MLEYQKQLPYSKVNTPVLLDALKINQDIALADQEFLGLWQEMSVFVEKTIAKRRALRCEDIFLEDSLALLNTI
jgi:hypothetical protein